MNLSKYIIDVGFNLLVITSFMVFVVGFLYKITIYIKTPQPLKIPQTPQSLNAIGVFFRMAADVLFFRSLLKGAKALWVIGLIFHYFFLLIMISHLRYFIYPVPKFLVSMSGIALIDGYVLLIAALMLLLRRLGRRFINPMVNYVSIFADYFVLVLIISIASTGILMRSLSRPDIIEIKTFTLGLITLSINSAPIYSFMFIIHITLVCLLAVYFPFSKLMHSGGYFFSPTRNMVNNPRDKRYINTWDN